ncbi:MAG: leucine-rich repeat domain-containing protein [Planctomycetaceae bacterium]
METPADQTAATKPIHRPPRRWFQFRLRTLMLVMLILPSSLGWLAQARSKSQKSWANVEALKPSCRTLENIDRFANPWWERSLGIDLPRVEEQLEIWLQTDDEEKSQADVLQHLSSFSHLKSLTISCPQCSAESLGPLTQLPGLVELKLDLGNVGDEPMSLPTLPHLKHLEVGVVEKIFSYEIFSATPFLESLILDVDDKDLKSTRGLGVLKGLKRLRIHHCGLAFDEEVSPSMNPLLVELGTLSELEDLELSIDIQSGVSIKPLTQLKKLKRLSIDGQISNVELAMLREISSIEYLNIDLGELTEEAAQHLSRMKNLRSLQIGAMLTTKGMEVVAKLPLLESLVVTSWKPAEQEEDSSEALEPLTRNPKLKHFGYKEDTISAQEIGVISRIVSLEELEIESFGLSPELNDELVKSLVHLPKLQRLTLCQCRCLTDEAIRTLASMPSLKELRFYESSITYSAVDEVQIVRPKLKIDLTPYSPYNKFR